MRSEYREANKGIGWVVGWVIAIFVLITLIGAFVWGASVLLSGPKGVGDGIVKKNSAENWIEAQAQFEKNYQEILTTDQKIGNAAATLATNSDDKTFQTNYSGLKSYCLSKVAEYNSDARSYLSEEFRAADLPQEISTASPATDCQE